MSNTNPEPLIPEGATYATGRQLARRYQVSVKWIAARATHMGAAPISDACNSELRYHLATADAYMESRQRRPTARPNRKPRAGKAAETTRTGAPLLTFK